MRGNRSGFTLLELVIVVLIVGVLANLAIPATQAAKRKAVAAATLADVQVIRTAILDFYADSARAPRNASWGAVPPELAASLPGGFAFDRKQVRYRWQRFGQRRQRRTGQIGRIRIRIKGRDNDLARTLRGLFNGRTTGNGRTLTLVIE